MDGAVLAAPSIFVLMRTTATGLVLFGLTLVAVMMAGTADVRAESRLQRVRARGYLVCGVESGVAGFATVDAQGRYAGLDIDMCRAVAAAIFGSDQKVRFV